MIPIEAITTPISCAAFGAAMWCNRSVIGWLPDDPPRAGRKQHGRPIPLAGIVLALLIPYLAWLGEWWLAIATAIAAGVGFCDDRGKEHDRDLDWRWKTLGLGIASLAVGAASIDATQQPWLFAGIACFAFVLTNATNFLDNTNGVCAGLSAVSLLCLSDGHDGAAVVGFAVLGFLPWNWPRARLFLGDAGAYLLGIVLAAFAARAAIVAPRALLATAVQLADFAQVIAARLALGLPPWVGDRRHLTHVAQNLGLPKPLVAPLFAGLALLAGWWAR